MSIPGALRKMVIERAGKRCEYCRLSQAGQEASFHIDHVRPVAENGETTEANLALACVSCSLRKGARRTGRDPVSGREILLFHPRRQSWAGHFAWKGNRVAGITPTGRATVELLKMNRALAVAIRAEERVHGRHPPAVWLRRRTAALTTRPLGNECEGEGPTVRSIRPPATLPQPTGF